jgi:hypothetical protein
MVYGYGLFERLFLIIATEREKRQRVERNRGVGSVVHTYSGESTHVI